MTCNRNCDCIGECKAGNDKRPMTPTDDLRARLHSANTLFERMLRECARPVTGSPEGVAWLAAEAYREVAIAALSALPAGGGGCGDHDHAKYIPGCPKCALTLPEKTTTPPPDVAVGAQGDGDAIEHAVDRFLAWPLPKDFGPDCGISFTPLGHPNGWPSGTNLLTAAQAKAMFQHCLAAPAAGKGVDDAMVERACEKSWPEARFTVEAMTDWPHADPLRRGHHQRVVRAALEAALTRQPVAGDGMVLVPREQLSSLADILHDNRTTTDSGLPVTVLECIDVAQAAATEIRRLLAAAPAATPTDGGEG